MRILSVVTLVSPDGAYGGPLRVAVNQARALREHGFDVTITASYRDYPDGPPEEMEGVPARLFPARQLVPRTGFAGLSSPGMLRYIHREARTFDVVHVHVARDLVTLPAAVSVRRHGIPYVVQPHGMIAPTTNPLARLMDPLLTFPILRDAARVLYLTPTERVNITDLLPDPGRLEHLVNGVPESEFEADPSTPEVLFLARLAARKRPRMLVDLANALVADFPEHRFRLVGPDEGEGPGVQADIDASTADVSWEGALSPGLTLERMARAGVYVLPSLDEPYGMSILEAMSVGLPVVITDQCGLSTLVKETGAGVVTDTSLSGLIEGVRAILGDVELARRMGAAGREAAHQQMGMPAIRDKLEMVYRAAQGADRRAG